jgi:hypothetical protein
MSTMPETDAVLSFPPEGSNVCSHCIFYGRKCDFLADYMGDLCPMSVQNPLRLWMETNGL